MKSKRSWTLVAGISLALVALLAASCAQPAPTPTPTPTVSPKPSPTPQPSPTATSAKTHPDINANASMPETMILLGGGAADSGFTLFARAYQDAIRKYWPKVATRLELSSAVKSVQRINENGAFLAQTIMNQNLLAWEGKAPFTQPIKNFRIAAVSPSGNAFIGVVRGDSPIKDISELKGKRIFVGNPGSQCEFLTDQLLQAGYGFGYKDIKAAGGLVFSGSYGDGTDQLLSGQMDASFWFLTNPQSDILRIASSPKGMRIITWNDKALQYLWSLPYGESRGFIPVGTYPGMTADVTQTSTSAFVALVNSAVPDDVLYNVLAATYENDGDHFKVLHPVHKSLNFISQYVGKEFTIPYHPGAKKFWWDLWKLRGLL